MKHRLNSILDSFTYCLIQSDLREANCPALSTTTLIRRNSVKGECAVMPFRFFTYINNVASGQAEQLSEQALFQ